MTLYQLINAINTIDCNKNSGATDRINAVFNAIKDIDHKSEDIIIDSIRDALYESYNDEINRMYNLLDKPYGKTAIETLSAQTNHVKWNILPENIIKIPEDASINAPFSLEELKDVVAIFDLPYILSRPLEGTNSEVKDGD